MVIFLPGSLVAWDIAKEEPLRIILHFALAIIPLNAIALDCSVVSATKASDGYILRTYRSHQQAIPSKEDVISFVRSELKKDLIHKPWVVTYHLANSADVLLAISRVINWEGETPEAYFGYRQTYRLQTGWVVRAIWWAGRLSVEAFADKGPPYALFTEGSINPGSSFPFPEGGLELRYAEERGSGLRLFFRCSSGADASCVSWQRVLQIYRHVRSQISGRIATIDVRSSSWPFDCGVPLMYPFFGSPESVTDIDTPRLHCHFYEAPEAAPLCGGADFNQ